MNFLTPKFQEYWTDQVSPIIVPDLPKQDTTEDMLEAWPSQMKECIKGQYDD